MKRSGPSTEPWGTPCVTRPGFLRIGGTAAVVKAEVAIAWDSEELKRLVR